MVEASEAAYGKQGDAAALADGLELLSRRGRVDFTRYERCVLPSDGSVFWVQTADTMVAEGSLHYSTAQVQAESESEGVSQVVFTSLTPVLKFNRMQPSSLWVGSYAGDVRGYEGPLTFAFSLRGRYYRDADLYHYQGTALTPTLATQLASSTLAVQAVGQVVSNSLPLWLGMNGYRPPYDNGIYMPLALYPSFLLPANLAPPFAAVHVEPGSSMALEAAPLLNQLTNQYSLTQEHVRITLYGANNIVASMFLAAVLQYSYDYDTIGLVNTPAIRDEKRTSAELLVVAQKKTIELDVTYYQSAVNDVLQQQISNWINNYFPQPLTARGFWPPAP